MVDSVRELVIDPEWLDHLGVGLVLQGPDGTVLRANASATRLLPGVAAGRALPVPPAGLRVVRREVGATGTVTALLVTPAEPSPPSALRDAELVRTIVQATPVGVCITDERGMFEQVNAAYERFYGYPAAELQGRHFTMVVPPEGRQELAELHDRFIADGAGVRGEWVVVRKDGSRATILADACRIIGADGRPRKVTFVVDITERRRIEDELARANQRLEYLATHDALTGLPNRRQLLTVLRDAVGLAGRYRGELTVAAIDLDRFKHVNDTWGHAAGDAVLRGFGELIADRLRATDSVGRTGGEEFVLVMPSTGAPGAAVVVAQLQELCRERVTIPDGSGLTFSCGLAAYRDGDSAEDLLRRADEALYRAKAAGRDRVEISGDSGDGPH